MLQNNTSITTVTTVYVYNRTNFIESVLKISGISLTPQAILDMKE